MDQHQRKPLRSLAKRRTSYKRRNYFPRNLRQWNAPTHNCLWRTGNFKKWTQGLKYGAATYSISVSRFKDQESGRPKLLWIDKINGSEITRYVDLNSDGQLDGITNDGSDVILSTLLSALATGDKKMFNAKLQQMGEKAERYQPMYEADYSRVYFLIKNLYNAPARWLRNTQTKL